jgi:hypothetical protein
MRDTFTHRRLETCALPPSTIHRPPPPHTHTPTAPHPSSAIHLGLPMLRGRKPPSTFRHPSAPISPPTPLALDRYLAVSLYLFIYPPVRACVPISASFSLSLALGLFNANARPESDRHSKTLDKADFQLESPQFEPAIRARNSHPTIPRVFPQSSAPIDLFALLSA